MGQTNKVAFPSFLPSFPFFVKRAVWTALCCASLRGARSPTARLASLAAKRSLRSLKPIALSAYPTHSLPTPSLPNPPCSARPTPLCPHQPLPAHLTTLFQPQSPLSIPPSLPNPLFLPYFYFFVRLTETDRQTDSLPLLYCKMREGRRASRICPSRPFRSSSISQT